MTIQLIWVPSHIGLAGNEVADKLAKQGCELGKQIPVSLSIREVYSIINKKIKQKNKVQWEHTKFKNKAYFDPIPTKLHQYSANPLLDKAYTKLKLGASCIGGDTLGNHKECRNCDITEDIKHIFFECPTYKAPREELFKELLKIGPIIITDKTLFNPPKMQAEQIRQAVFQFLTDGNIVNKVVTMYLS